MAYEHTREATKISIWCIYNWREAILRNHKGFYEKPQRYQYYVFIIFIIEEQLFKEWHTSILEKPQRYQYYVFIIFIIEEQLFKKPQRFL